MILTFPDDKQVYTVNDGSVTWKLFHSLDYHYLFLECGVNELGAEQLKTLIEEIRVDRQAKSILIFAPFLLSGQAKVIGDGIRDVYNLILFHVNQAVVDEITPDHIFSLVNAQTPEAGYAEAIKHLTGNGTDYYERNPIDYEELKNDAPDDFEKTFKGIKAQKIAEDPENDGVF